MTNIVTLRSLEDRDIDFIYKCKNDDNLNSMTMGQHHPFSYEEAEKWVHNCMKGDRSDLKFWAICTNDEEKRVVGWVSLSEIDYQNKSACHHGLVIGDKDYQDGTPMFEAMLLSMKYAFDILKVHRLYGSCIADHKVSPYLLKTLGFSLEGKKKDACFKNNNYYDVLDYALLDIDYYNNINSGYYNLSNLIKTFVKIIKNSS